METKQRDSMIFYRSFYEALRDLDGETKAVLYDAIFEFGLNRSEPVLTGIAKTVFTLIRPQLEANLRKFDNGTKGGRPPMEEPNDNQNETTEEPNDNQSESKSEANVNGNGNVNGNDNQGRKKELPPAHPLTIWIAKDCPRVAKMKQPLTDEEAAKLEADLGIDSVQKAQVLKDLILSMQNYGPLTKSVSANLTIRNWWKRDRERNPLPQQVNNYPRVSGTIL